MKKNNFSYYLQEGVRGTFLHGFMSFAAVCVIIACLVIVGGACVIMLNLSNMVSELEAENEILVYIEEDLSSAEAKSVGSSINMIENVEEAVFVSREEALENYVAQQDNPDLFNGLDASTFRDRYRVTLTDLEAIESTVASIEQIDGVAKVSAHYEIAQGFVTVRGILNLAAMAIIVILLVISLLIVSNTVKLALYDRKEEIGIMKMVGATDRFIQWPFVIEGFLLGIIGAAIAFFILWGLYALLCARLANIDTLHIIHLIGFRQMVAPLAIAFGVSGFLVGVFGSLLSIRKFLDV